MNRRMEWDVLDLTVDNEKDLSDGKFDMQLKRLVDDHIEAWAKNSFCLRYLYATEQ